MSAVYEKAGEAFLTRKVDWEGDEIRALLVTGDYRPNLLKDESLADIPKKARVHVSPPLAGKVAKGFTCGANNILLERVFGPKCEAVVLFKQGDKESTSRLIAYIDEADFLPFTPNGGDLDMGWDGGKIFSF